MRAINAELTKPSTNEGKIKVLIELKKPSFKGTKPATGNYFNHTPKTIIKIKDNQKLGIDNPKTAKLVKILSIHVPLFRAAKIPETIPIKLAIINENIERRIVGCNLSIIDFITGLEKNIEFPKSNLNNLKYQLNNLI